MTKRKRRYHRQPRTKPIVEKLPLGTIIPDIQHETIEGDVVHDVTETLDGQSISRRRAVRKVIREPMVQRDTWDDPLSVNPKAKKPLQRHGFRRSNAVLYLAKTSPDQVTPRHVAVCELYLDDRDAAIGVFGSGMDLSGVRGGAVPSGPAELQLIAIDTMRHVHKQLGESGKRLLDALVVGDSEGKTMSLGEYATTIRANDAVAKGMLLQVLNRLIEIYTPAVVGRAVHAIAISG